MNPVQVRNCVFGEGVPKICIPIVAENEKELRHQLENLQQIPYDLIEWRADWFSVLQEDKIREMIAVIRKEIGEKPLLFTIRTKAEGGELSPEIRDYVRWNEIAAEAGADLVDAELFSGDGVVCSIIENAHRFGAKVIGSSHDFQKTPSLQEMENRLEKMEVLGCDIAKLAVMPETQEDVFQLLHATEQMNQVLKCPVITMSMSAKGIMSRIAGEIYGSCLTFGSAGKSSAPGQMEAAALKQCLENIHRSLTVEKEK